MQGLQFLHLHTGRHTEWAHLVDEIVPYFVESSTDGPVVGREMGWSIITGFRVSLALKNRQLTLAHRLQSLVLDSARQDATSILSIESDALDYVQRNVVRTLSVLIR